MITVRNAMVWILLIFINMPILFAIYLSVSTLSGRHSAAVSDVLPYSQHGFSEKMWSSFETTMLLAWASATIASVAIFVLGVLFKYYMIQPSLMLSVYMAPGIAMPDALWAAGLYSGMGAGLYSPGVLLTVAVHVTFNLSLAYYILIRLGAIIDSNTIHAARILGLSPIRTICQIALPQHFMSYIACFLLCFVFSADDFLLTFTTSGTEIATLPVFLYNKLKFGISGKLIQIGLLQLLAITLAMSFAIIVYGIWAKVGKT